MTVKFLMGTQAGYEALTDIESTTFYFTGTNLYLGNILLSNGAEIAEILQKLVDDEGNIENIETVIGSLEDLSTTNKNNLVSAINEVLAAVGSGGTDAVVSIVENSDSGEYAVVYNVYQGGSLIGVINIPKDLVVESGDVEVNPREHQPGTYIVLTLANADNQKIYIDVADLVDIYTVEENATQIQLTIYNNEISAAIVAGGITTEDIADNAITSSKIADGNVTTDKLSITIQNALESAEGAIHSITSGSENGTIAVDGVNVSVTGLGSAAYTSVTQYDAAGNADIAEFNAKAYADSLLEWGSY